MTITDGVRSIDGIPLTAKDVSLGKAWSSLGRPLDPITQDAGKELATHFSAGKAAIHQNHGRTDPDLFD